METKELEDRLGICGPLWPIGGGQVCLKGKGEMIEGWNHLVG